MTYDDLFDPIQIGDTTLSNRIAMAPMNMGYTNPLGYSGEQSMAWYATRARGGFGLIITECTVVNPHPWRGCDSLNPSLMTDQRYYRYLSEMLKLVHSISDTKVFIQLSPGWGRQGHASFATPWIPSAGPSPVPMEINYRNLNAKGWTRQLKRLIPGLDEIIKDLTGGEKEKFEDIFTMSDDDYQVLWVEMQKLFFQFSPDLKNYFMSEIPRPLEINEIVEMEDKMATQAFAAFSLGFDGVEIHSPHGYLIHSFLSSRSNQRIDEYGGSIENRARFLTNIIQKTRAKIGPDKPLGVRLSGDECMPEGVTIEEAKQFASMSTIVGANYINVSQGSYENPSAFSPHGEDEFVQYGPGFKKASNLPVIAPGFIRPETANQAIASGMIDIASLGRQSIADPYWPLKVKEGRVNDIVKCSRCNQCLMELQESKWISCTVNPTAGREKFFPELWMNGAKFEKKTRRYLSKLKGETLN